MSTIESKKTTGCLALFGLPFFAAGCFFLYAMLESSVKWNGERPTLYVGIPFSLVFILIGATVMVGRSGYVIDTRRKKGYFYLGLLIPLYKKHFDLSKVDYINISSELRSNKNSSYTVYPLTLIPYQGKPIKIENYSRDYIISRERAEKIARRCQVRLKNEVEGGEILDPSQIDQAFLEKLRSRTFNLSRPEKSNIEIKEIQNETRITSHYASKFLTSFLPILYLLIFICPIWLIFLNKGINNSWQFELAITAFFALPIFATVLRLLLSFNTGFEVKITKTTLQVFYRGLIPRKKSIEIREIDDIHSVEIANIPSIVKLIKSISGLPHANVTLISNETKIGFWPFESNEDALYFKELLEESLAKRI
ncbi:hypothetical protein HBN50_01225 [Halobacteriovorax sp. GB3]|uniref:hypothetical protein n=1 Tax=Halobacteriovorax sp. GB3 TaxID=2719615 RepID=UPI00235DF94F|nr:hypothetical protein [Halobacteriovorax sp. GB3]MDD0851689.1 hypothetical protein [Halobacteriovorax sp. GB3]